MFIKKLLHPGNEPTGGQNGNLAEITFTKEEVNELMQRRVARSHEAFFKRYGVKDLSELDALMGYKESYDTLNVEHENLKKERDDLSAKYGDLETQHKDLTKRYAYKVGNINNEKINDIETYFKGKNLDINEESLMAELKTHPDWANKVSTIESIGIESTPTPPVDEAVEASNIFGVDLTN